MPLPPGVTLQQIDGGPTYYASNGFTYAANAGFNGMSWDDPRFFPIASDYCFYSDNSTATFFDLGLNFTHRVTGGTDLSICRNAGIWAILTPGEGTDYGEETVGWHIEEPGTWADIESIVQSAGAGIPGRFFQTAFTWNQLYFGTISGAPGDSTMPYVMNSPISTTAGNVHLNIPGTDLYWMAGNEITGMNGPPYEGSLIYGVSSNLTADQCARGPHYGDMVDTMRGWLTTYPAPVMGPYIENEDALLTGGRLIIPPELNWAAWSVIIHGGRGLLYFGSTSDVDVSYRFTFGFAQDIISGQSISIYDQAKATNALVTQLAPVINSQTALGYFTVSPPPVKLAGATPDSGIDAMAKYYTGGYTPSPGWYIFATTRDSETATSISATFTTADQYSGPVTVVNESRTVTATNGVFTDTFATGAAVHIYRIPLAASSPWASPVSDSADDCDRSFAVRGLLW